MISNAEKFFALSHLIEGGCWQWDGGKHSNGYGYICIERKSIQAHRWIYEQLIGKIPRDLESDHLCRKRDCVNPYHLEMVTHQENVRRGLNGKIPNWLSQRTHCKHGHAFDPSNTRIYLQRSRGVESRRCRKCNRIQCKKWRNKCQQI